jgi:hypothetical protein
MLVGPAPEVKSVDAPGSATPCSALGTKFSLEMDEVTPGAG